MLIPEAFKQYRQFIVYKTKLKDNGKLDKIPVDANTLVNHDAHDPSIWMDHELAVSYADVLGQGYGVGFVFTNNDPFWFLDIDGAYDGQQWSPLALDLINRTAGAFVEVSLSGTGLHVFGTGLPPEHCNKNKPLNLEFYTKDRFVALTGLNAYGDAAAYINGPLNDIVTTYFPPSEFIATKEWTTEPRAEWNGPEDDKQLIEKALASQSTASVFGGGVTFADLWSRNVDALAEQWPHETNDYDASSADASLAQRLAFWTGCNCERIERLMRQSALVRDKWDSHKSYLQMTITNACASQKDVYSSKPRQQVISANVDLTDYESMIREQAVTAQGIKDCITKVRNSPLSTSDKRILAGLITEQSKLSGLPMSKNDVNHGVLGFGVEKDENIHFVDLKSTGKPKGTKENLIALLNYYQITVRYNLMSKDLEIVVPGTSYTTDNATNCAVADIISLCQRHDLPINIVDHYILNIGDDYAYNPVVNWIQNTQWDGVDRFTQLLETLDASDPIIANVLLRKWLITAVAGAFNPLGVAASGMLVLQGGQYIGKTRWFWQLLGGNKEWGKEAAILDPHNKDSVKQCVSYWLVELGELDATFKKSDIAALKGYITKDKDEFRRPYARSDSKYPRRTVYFGSVNPKHFLHDETGNRRFWTIECGDKFNCNHGIDAAQLWAQVYQWYIAGERYWLSNEENDALNSHNLQFEPTNPYVELIQRAYDFTVASMRELTVTEIAEELRLEPTDQRVVRSLVSTLDKLGVKSYQKGIIVRYKMPTLKAFPRSY